jgi:hypothetical protein
MKERSESEHAMNIGILLEVLEAGPCDEEILAIRAGFDYSIKPYVGSMVEMGLATRDGLGRLEISERGLVFLEENDSCSEQNDMIKF